MAKIKIISNPYSKNIKYYQWYDSDEKWSDINPSSKLKNSDFEDCFFPFKVQDIVDIIKEEYEANDEIITVVFEGTSDEYRELVNVCEEEQYKGSIRVTKGEKYLDNAREILPDIIQIFQEIYPLTLKNAPDNTDIKKNLKKFVDSSNDTIPICILGNYSSGKSTFINALIGHDILPSGDEPVTARIFQIKRSKKEDEAEIVFFHGAWVRIAITNDSFAVKTNSDNDLINKIKEQLEKNRDKSLEKRVNIVLSIINTYPLNCDEAMGDQTIIIEVPFISDVLTNPKNDFVIFDTPGSNTASNEKHIKVLESALQDLSNGLPIFVSEYDSLDSTDNEKLYKKIIDMKQLDDRFTMIIVNKADSANLPKAGFTDEAKEKLLAEAVPKNLYSEGIYFVSSIMGLGSKIDGNFVDDYYAEIYDGNEKKFSDPSSRFYRNLYQYNILPNQLIEPMIEDAKSCENLVFANSGLYSVEKEIDTFANKYSSYNKANQSLDFLNNIIDSTKDEIDANTKQREINRDHLIDQFKEKQKILANLLRYNTVYLTADFSNDYGQEVLSIVPSYYPNLTSDELEDTWTKINEKNRKSLNYDNYINNGAQANSAISSNLVDGLKRMFEETKDSGTRFSNLKDDVLSITKQLLDDVNFAKDNRDANKAFKDFVNWTSSLELLDQIKIQYKDHYYKSATRIQKQSQKYSDDRTQEFRNALDKIVLESDGIDDQQRSELSEIITNFEIPVIEDEVNNLFQMDKFDRALQIGFFKVGDKTTLDYVRLSDAYNYTMEEILDNFGNQLKETTNQRFSDWAYDLLNTVIEHLTEHNPQLKQKSLDIKEESEKIRELISYQNLLLQGQKKIEEMLDWKS